MLKKNDLTQFRRQQTFYTMPAILITVGNKRKSIRIFYHIKPAKCKCTLAKLYKQYCRQKYYFFCSRFTCLQNGVLLNPSNVAWITQCKHHM